MVIQNKFRFFTKKSELFAFAKKSKFNYSIYPSFVSEENNNTNKTNLKIKLYNNLNKSDYYVLPVKFCKFRNCFVFDLPKNQFSSKTRKLMNFNFISGKNKVIVDPKYKTILLGDSYVNQIDFKKFDKKEEIKKRIFKLNDGDESINSSDYSEKEEILALNDLNCNIANLKKVDSSSKLDNDCLFLSNTFSNSTKDSIIINSSPYKKGRRKRAKSILKNREGSKSATKIRESRSIKKRVSFGSSQISFYKSDLYK